MYIKSIRRITNDANHNAFTGACWFKGALFVAFRQGDAHVDPGGRLVVIRSRDEGISFDLVAVLRGQFDTRDAHLYEDGKRLWLTGFEYDYENRRIHSGYAYSEDGIHWSAWQRMQETGNYVMWRAKFFKGKYYCAGYTGNGQARETEVSWFESDDGMLWRRRYVIHGGADCPSECYLDFKSDGSAAILMRCDDKSNKPYLLRSNPPYDKWSKVRLNIPLSGPALWFAGDDIWISGRWFVNPDVAHVGIFKIVDSTPVLRLVLPSGPDFDCSYMGVAKREDNPARFSFSYYSGHEAPGDPRIGQFNHPDIYLVDAIFSLKDIPFIQNWKVSRVQQCSLKNAVPPDPNDASYGWRDLSAYGERELKAGKVTLSSVGFVDAGSIIQRTAGVIWFTTEIDVGPCSSGRLYLGYDGPVAVWVNKTKVFEGTGTNPAIADQNSVRVKFNHGANCIMICLDTNGGRAQGVFCRWTKEE